MTRTSCRALPRADQISETSLSARTPENSAALTMGRSLDLSQLTDAEAQHVWAVVQRDLDLRRREEERLRGLRGVITREAAGREELSDGASPSHTRCACRPQPNEPREPGSPCLDCGHPSCPRCGHARPEEQGWLCHSCHLARVVRIGSLEWYYGHLRARFKSFGSAKVIRSLSGRLQTAGGDVLCAGQGSSDSEQTDEEADPHLLQPLGGRVKRRLSIHHQDLLGSQEVTLTPTDSLEALTDEPSSEGTRPTEEVDASNLGCHPGPEEQTWAPLQEALAGHCPPAEADPRSPSVTAEPGPDDPGAQRVSPQALAASDGESSGDHGEAPHWSQRSSSAASESQSLAPSAADREEAALRRKLERLVTHLSEDEEDGVRAGHSDTRGESPRAAPKVPSQVLRAESPPRSPRDPTEGSSRTAAQDLAELEDRVAEAASEVQQAESEVTDIQSRIAALQAAGLTVRPAGTTPRKSSLPVLLPRRIRRPGQSPDPPRADAPTQAQVVAAPHALGAPPKGPPRTPGSSFERESLYRKSLTQRNPSGKATTRLSFAKPVMAHQP